MLCDLNDTMIKDEEIGKDVERKKRYESRMCME